MSRTATRTVEAALALAGDLGLKLPTWPNRSGGLWQCWEDRVVNLSRRSRGRADPQWDALVRDANRYAGHHGPDEQEPEPPVTRFTGNAAARTSPVPAAPQDRSAADAALDAIKQALALA